MPLFLFERAGFWIPGAPELDSGILKTHGLDSGLLAFPGLHSGLLERPGLDSGLLRALGCIPASGLLSPILIS